MKRNRLQLLILASLALGYCLGRKVIAAKTPQERTPARKSGSRGGRPAGAPRSRRRPASSAPGEPKKSTG